MTLRDLLVRAKVWMNHKISGYQTRPKIPRKKVQIQFHRAIKKLLTQQNYLQQALVEREMEETTRLMGKELLNDVKRFQEHHLSEINKQRLDSINKPLLHPIDFSLWVIYEIHSLTDQIYHFLTTMEVVEL